jgi:hypothetical protein
VTVLVVLMGAWVHAEGVMCGAKDFYKAKHDDVEVPNLEVINLMKSLKSRGYVRETFNWCVVERQGASCSPASRPLRVDCAPRATPAGGSFLRCRLCPCCCSVLVDCWSYLWFGCHCWRPGAAVGCRQWYYWYLTDAGIEYLRGFLHLPADIVPETLKKPAPRPGQRPLDGGESKERRPFGRGAGAGGFREGGYREGGFRGERPEGGRPRCVRDCPLCARPPCFARECVRFVGSGC